MPARHIPLFSWPLIAALTVYFFAERGFARAEKPFAETLIVPQPVSTIVAFEGYWATALCYAAQTNRLPLPQPVSEQAISSAFMGMETSLVVSTGGSIFDPAGSVFSHTASSKSGAQVSFASGINDADADAAAKESVENSALFYSAGNAPNASSENGVRESGGQIRTKRGASGSAAAPSAAGLFPVPTQQ